MDWKLASFRSSLMLAMGLVACGPGTKTSDTQETDTGGPPAVCDDAKPIMQVGAPDVATGWVVCANGTIHRDAPAECVDPTPSGTACDIEGQDCMVDADCDAREHGRCVYLPSMIEPICGCVYGCTSDADCPGGTICACAGETTLSNYPGASRCIPAECTLSDDCGGQLCAIGSLQDGCGANYEASCTTPTDTCHADADCDVDCHPEGANGQWECVDLCCCGRPFVVAGEARVAGLRARGDWLIGHVSRDLMELSRAARRRLVTRWGDAARMEHASIAAFARFSLQLLARGAPPELLRDASRATRDEVDHARRCFALLSAYAGGPAQGPAALDVVGVGAALGARERALVEVVFEACVGETLAAVEAAAALRVARAPAVREALATIARDELRHAAPGWRTLRWALRREPEARDRVARAFADAIAEARAELARAPVHEEPDCEAHGLLDERARRELLAAALRDVVTPCARALLDAAHGEGARAPV
ncbi:MAG: ferritin-like domain-containing protein [Myxococcales bacterium]|nr:ferritin-like domain-containing protein [Myxococcales bacterium]